MIERSARVSRVCSSRIVGILIGRSLVVGSDWKSMAHTMLAVVAVGTGGSRCPGPFPVLAGGHPQAFLASQVLGLLAVHAPTPAVGTVVVPPRMLPGEAV